MHKHLLIMKKEHGIHQLHEDCFDALTKILELYKYGKTNEDVDKLLPSSGSPMTVEVVGESGEIVNDDISEVDSDIKAALGEKKQASAKQKDFNEILLNLLETQSEKFDTPTEIH